MPENRWRVTSLISDGELQHAALGGMLQGLRVLRACPVSTETWVKAHGQLAALSLLSCPPLAVPQQAAVALCPCRPHRGTFIAP